MELKIYKMDKKDVKFIVGMSIVVIIVVVSIYFAT